MSQSCSGAAAAASASAPVAAAAAVIDKWKTVVYLADVEEEASEDSWVAADSSC